MSDAKVMLSLTRAEALVLFEWVARTDSAGLLSVVDPAEEIVLWEIEAQLQKTLVEPLLPEYERLVAEARTEIRKLSMDDDPI